MEIDSHVTKKNQQKPETVMIMVISWKGKRSAANKNCEILQISQNSSGQKTDVFQPEYIHPDFCCSFVYSINFINFSALPNIYTFWEKKLLVI